MFSWLTKKSGDTASKGNSRREFLRGDFMRSEPKDKAKVATSIALLRPPGAIEESEFLAACTRCGDCVSACPKNAIQLASPRMREAAGTPIINAFDAPCWMCADKPCVPACSTDALQDVLGFNMGLAQLQTFHCLAYNQSFCSTCEERCPANAITLTDGKPKIVADLCTGCGVCHHVCPAPYNAIMILPNRERTSSQPDV